jgi:cysteine sulfinate desulfinase/cysteine desulfurase-like protein
LRAGTENVTGIAGLGKAWDISQENGSYKTIFLILSIMRFNNCRIRFGNKIQWKKCRRQQFIYSSESFASL